MELIRRSLRITLTSLRLIKSRVGLLVFSALSVVTSIILLGGTAFSTYLLLAQKSDDKYNILIFYAFFFALFFIGFLVWMFFNAGLIACARSVLLGERMTITKGFGRVLRNLRAITSWALLSAVLASGLRVLLTLNIIPISILTVLVGLAWIILTYVFVSVSLFEDSGLFLSVKRSLIVLSKTWVENLLGRLPLLLLLLLLLPVGLLPLGFALKTKSLDFLIPAAGLGLGYLAILAAVIVCIDWTIAATVYEFAVTGEVPSLQYAGSEQARDTGTAEESVKARRARTGKRILVFTGAALILAIVVITASFWRSGHTDDGRLTKYADEAIRDNPAPWIPTYFSIPIFKEGHPQLVGTTMDDPMYAPYYDVLVGTPAGWDIFMSVDPSAERPGKGEIDAHDGSNQWDFLDGDKHGDLFICGDYNRPYYAGKTTPSDKEKDFVYITRFDPRASVIRLHGSPDDYVLAPTNESAGTALFLKKNEDMIAVIEGVGAEDLNLHGPRFQYDTAPSASPSIPGLDQLGGPGVQNVGCNATDDDGNVYMVFQSSGETPNIAGEGSFCVLKYDSDGRLAWARKYGTTNGGSELPFRIVVAGKEVFVCGGTNGAYGGPKPPDGTAFIGFVAKIDGATGDELAVKQVDPGNQAPFIDKPIEHGFAWSICADNGGNIYVAGGTSANGAPLPAVSPWIAKVRQSDLSIVWKDVMRSGVPIYQLSHEALGGVTFVPDGSGVPGKGSIYTAGYTTNGPFYGSSLVSNDSFYVKYDDRGNQIWGESFGVYSRHEYPWDIATDSSGNMYIVGGTMGALDGQKYSGNGDGYVCKMDKNGRHIWTRLIGTGGSDTVHSIRIVGDDIYISGDTTGELAGKYLGMVDIYIARMSTGGDLLSMRQFGTEKVDNNFDLSVSNGTIFVSGQTEGSMVKTFAGGLDVFLTAFDAETLEFR